MLRQGRYTLRYNIIYAHTARYLYTIISSDKFVHWQDEMGEGVLNFSPRVFWHLFASTESYEDVEV